MTFINNLNPTIFHFGTLEIRWYGVMYVIGFTLAYFILIKLSKERNMGLTKDDISDYLFHIIIGTILGARIVYILVYNSSYYFHNPLEMFMIWKGGLSFHGGLIGALIAGYIFCKNKKVNYLELADISVIPLALALIFGRVGNFINGELYGKITSLPWGVKFNNESVFRHPSQLYESFTDLIIFTTLWNIRNKNFKKGTLFWTFILMYSVLRFLVGFFRLPDVQIGYIFHLTMGQWLNMIMFSISIILIYKINKQ